MARLWRLFFITAGLWRSSSLSFRRPSGIGSVSTRSRPGGGTGGAPERCRLWVWARAVAYLFHSCWVHIVGCDQVVCS